MKITIQVDNTGRVVAAANEGIHICPELDIEVERPRGFLMDDLNSWVLRDGVLEYQPKEKPMPMLDPMEERLEEIEAAMMELAAMIGGE